MYILMSNEIEPTKDELDAETSDLSTLLGLFIFRDITISSYFIDYWANQVFLHPRAIASIKACVTEFLCHNPSLSLEISKNPLVLIDDKVPEYCFWIDLFLYGWMKVPCEYLKKMKSAKQFKMIMGTIAAISLETREAFTQINNDSVEHRIFYSSFRFNREFGKYYNKIFFLLVYIAQWYRMCLKCALSFKERQEIPKEKNALIVKFSSAVIETIIECQSNSNFNQYQSEWLEKIKEVLSNSNKMEAVLKISDFILLVHKEDEMERMDTVKNIQKRFEA
jgi:hypothetical protein